MYTHNAQYCFLLSFVVHTMQCMAWYSNKSFWCVSLNGYYYYYNNFTALFPGGTTTTILWPFFRDHPGDLMPEENFWALWCKGRLTEADTLTIRLGATPSGLTRAHLHHPPFFSGQMPFLPPNQQCQSTEGNYCIRIREKMLKFFSTLLPAPSPYLKWLLIALI